MKRKLITILSLMLVIALGLGVLVACQKGPSTEQLDSLYKEFTKLHKNDAKESATSFWVEGDVFVLEDGGKEISVKIKWTIEGTTLVKVGETPNSNGQYQIIVPDEVDEEVNYKLVGVMVDEKGNAYTDKDGKEYKLEISKVVPAGKAYNLAIRQLTEGTVIYATATKVANYYVGSVETAAGAATFFTEDVDGGKKIYTMVGSTKSYLGAKISGSHNNIILGGIVNDDSSNYEGSVWTIADNEIKTVVDGKTLYLGTYGDKTTFSVSETKTYPAFLVEAGPEVKPAAMVGVSDQSKNCTVKFTSHTADANNTVTVDLGTVVTFTVTPEDGQEIISVRNGSQIITAQNGVYSITVNTGVSIIVESNLIGSNGATSPVEGKINNLIPVGWTYVPNNPNYPTPDFYGNGGLKVNFAGIGMLSPVLDGATGNITVTVTIGALNKGGKEKTENGHIFTVEALDNNGEVILTEYIDTFTIDDKNVAVLNASGKSVAQVRVVLNELPAKDGFAHNVNLGAVTITWGGTETPADPEAKIGNTSYATLLEAIEAVKNGETIVLQKDVVSGGIFLGEGSRNFTIDLNTHKLTIGKPLVGSTGTVSQSIHLEKGNTVVFKNGTINCQADSAQMLIQNYCNLTLDGVTLDGTNLKGSKYTLSNNFGTVVIKGNSKIIAAENGVAFDLWYGMFAQYDEGLSVTVEAGCTITGKIEYGAHSRITGTDWVEKAVLVLPEGTYDIVLTRNDITREDANITIGTAAAE